MTPPIADLRVRLSACRGVLVDSNVLLDLTMKDSNWGEWSRSALSEVGDIRPLIVNPIVYAEVSVRFPTIDELDAALPESLYQREDLPWEAGFLAGKCYLAYRRRGGQRRSPIPDFYIGAHAAVGRLALLTRDPARYRSYFPTVQILAPTKTRM